MNDSVYSDESISEKSTLLALVSRVSLYFLIVTLPFFSFRSNAVDGSITNLAMVFVSLAAFFLVIFGRAKTSVFNGFDVAHIAFLLLAMFSVIFVQVPESDFVLLKSSLFFVFFIALKIVISQGSTRQFIDDLVKACRLGLIFYSLLFGVALIKSGVIATVLSGGANFYTFTYVIYKEMFSILNISYELTPPGVRRNTIAGIFAFYFGILLLAQTSWRGEVKVKKINIDLVLSVVAVVYVLALFSRRALIMCFILLICAGAYSKVSKFRLILLGASGVVITSFAFVALQVDNRFTEISGDSRYAQFADAITGYLEHPIVGSGYGALLGVGNTVYIERFIHNYHLANAYMLGIGGLIFSGYVTFLILKNMIKIPFNKSYAHQSLLIIPLLSMLVSGAVGGIYVPMSWIIFAICMRKTL